MNKHDIERIVVTVRKNIIPQVRLTLVTLVKYFSSIKKIRHKLT
jgi:hypothetical protein